MAEPLAPDKRAVRRAFERAARTYDRNAVLHCEIGLRLIAHLDPIRLDPKRVLDLGSGTGLFLPKLRGRFPKAELVALDIARPMLSIARGRTPWLQRTLLGRGPRLVCGDAERMPLRTGSVDFVFSNLALQWCRPQAVFAEAARVLAPGGLFLFSTFGPDTLKELRAAFGEGGDRHVNAFADMHDLGDGLVHAGLADPVMEMETITLEYSRVEKLLRDLQAVGARNAQPDRPRGLVGREFWRGVIDRYEAARRNGVLPVTYEVVYGHAWKVAPREAADGRQVVTFHPRTMA